MQLEPELSQPYTSCMSVEEIEAAISELPSNALAELANWFMEYHASMWDQQLEADISSGKLDQKARQAKDDFTAGLRKPL